jgi:2-haloacid dehalogenase
LTAGARNAWLAGENQWEDAMAGKQPVAIVFDTFGTVVNWRGSLIAELTAFGKERGINADWTALVDAWRAAYHPSMDRVRKGEQPWTTLDNLHRASLDKLVAEFGIAGLTEADLTHINLGWHRLHPWPDSVPGLTRLKRKFIIGPLSNGNVSLLLNMAKHAGIPWDMIFGSDLFRHFKPDPETYLGVAKLLNIEPGQVMMAAAHNGDLGNARKQGLMTAFFPRPSEYGPHQKRDYAAEQDWDVVAKDIEDLATQLGA